MLSLKSNPYPSRSINWITYETPYMRSDLGRTAFSSLAPNTWNELQNTFKLAELHSIGHFKELIRDCCISVCNCPTLMSISHLNVILCLFVLHLVLSHVFVFSN